MMGAKRTARCTFRPCWSCFLLQNRCIKSLLGLGIAFRWPLEYACFASENRITEEIRQNESTMSKFIEQIILEHYEKGAITMGKTRTMAFQVSEELFQQIKDYLARYEQVYHRKLTQKEFVIGLIEQALEEADEEFAAAEADEVDDAVDEFDDSDQEDEVIGDENEDETEAATSDDAPEGDAAAADAQESGDDDSDDGSADDADADAAQRPEWE